MAESDGQNGRPLRLLLVDDDPIVRMGLMLMLRSMREIEIIAEARDGAEVLQIIERENIDAILMDVRMPTVHGIAASRAVRARYPHVRIVLMSTMHNDDFAAHATNLGCAGFVAKSDSPAAFRAALVGKSRAHQLAPRPYRPQLNMLSRGEFEVAELVARGYANSQIADELHLSVNTVKTYVSRCLAKLDLTNRVQLANAINGHAFSTGYPPPASTSSASAEPHAPTRDGS